MKQKFGHKIVNIFLPISFNICFGYSKEPSHCFELEIRKLILWCQFLTKGLLKRGADIVKPLQID